MQITEEFKILNTGEKGICLKEFYRGYEISISMGLDQDGEYYSRDIRIYLDKMDLTYAFHGLMYPDVDSFDNTCEIPYNEDNYDSIKKFIEVMVGEF